VKREENKNMLAVFKREFKSYFQNPNGYIFMSIFLLISGILFANGNILAQNPRYPQYLGSLLFIFLLTVPILTMRIFTDDRKQHTDQLLFTAPVRITDIVVGKYLAAVLFFTITLAVTVLYALLISVYGRLDVGETIGAYLGFLFLGCAFIAVGVFVSSATENQVTCTIITFCALLIVWLMDMIKQSMPTDMVTGIVFAAILIGALCVWIYFSTRNLLITIISAGAGAGVILIFYFIDQTVYFGFISKVLDWFSLLSRYNGFIYGVFKLSTIVYYLSFSAFFLFLTVRLIEKKRWS
jgi:ABC-2 type transport system permease protein